jgi:hypothetical protein
MKFSEIPKFVINLKRRPDRLESIKKEMDYMGWDYEIFEGVDIGSYMGCTLSHFEIFKIAEERGYKKVMIIEDDTQFMPFAHDLIEKIESEIGEFDYINFGPTLNRKLNIAEGFKYLLDLRNMPPKEREEQRGIYTTNCCIYDSSIFDMIRKIDDVKFHDGSFYYAIDDYIYQFVMPNSVSYCPILPITTQGNDYSDVSGGMYNNFYTQTYNWNHNSPLRLPGEFSDMGKNLQKKENKIKDKINI